MMDKKREAFEKWFAGTRSCLEDKSKMFEKDELGYTDELAWTAFAAWQEAWQSSRQAIEVELPEAKPSVTYTNSGFNWALRECKNYITSLGIRVKGKTE